MEEPRDHNAVSFGAVDDDVAAVEEAAVARMVLIFAADQRHIGQKFKGPFQRPVIFPGLSLAEGFNAVFGEGTRS